MVEPLIADGPQFFFRSMAMGVLTRAALISAIYKRSLSLSIGSRAQHPNGKLINHLSSDVSLRFRCMPTDILQISRIDYCAQCELLNRVGPIDSDIFG